MFYALLSPFKVQTDITGSGEYALRNKFQMLACMATHAGTLGISFLLLLSHLQKFLSPTSNISSLLESIGYSSTVFAISVFVKTLWRNQDDILAFVRVSKVSPVPYKAIYLGTLLVHLLQLVTSYLTGTIHHAAKTYTGWMIPAGKEPADSPFIYVLHAVYGILFGVYALGVTLYAMGRVVTMIMSVQLKVMGKEFEKFLEQENCVRKVVQKLDHLRETVKMGSKWTNYLVIFYYISILTFLANLPDVLRNGYTGKHDLTGIEKWHAVFTCATQGLFLLISCDMPARVQNSLQKWIAQKRSQEGLSHDERFLLLALVHDIERQPVGLSCSFFTLTYSFIGSMLGLMTTYGVLVFQMNK